MKPVRDRDQPSREQPDVEPQVPGGRLLGLLALGEQVHEQRAEPRLPQHRGHRAVARASAAASRAVGEQDHRPRLRGQREVPDQRCPVRVHPDFARPLPSLGRGLCGAHVVAGAGRGQQVPHLLVGGLIEVVVEAADGHERLRGGEAHDLVHLAAERGARGRGGHRHGHDHLGRMLPSKRRHRRAHRRSGGEPVVHEDDRAPGEGRRRAVATIRTLAAVELARFLRRHAVDRFRADGERVHHLVVDDAHAARRDRAHGQLLLPGRAQLADDEHVQGRVEAPRDLVRHGDSTPRQPEHDQPPPAPVGAEAGDELAAGVGAVAEQHQPPSTLGLAPRGVNGD